MKLDIRGSEFMAFDSYHQRHELSSAGFRWRATFRAWVTDSYDVARRFAKYATPEAWAQLARRFGKENIDPLIQQNPQSTPPLAQRKPQADVPPAKIAAIHQIVRMLAGYCDGARTVDNQGFNKMDTNFGKNLADRSQLTPNQAAAAIKICRKYRRQIPADLYEEVYGVGSAKVKTKKRSGPQSQELLWCDYCQDYGAHTTETHILDPRGGGE